MELHLDAAVLVGVDLLAAGTDDQRRLRPLHDRLRRHAGRTELLRAGHAREAAIEIAVVLAAAGAVVIAARLVGRRGDQVFAVLVVARKAGEREERAHGETTRIADPVHHLIARAQLVEADARQAASGVGSRVGARIVAHLALGMAVPARIVHIGAEVQRRLLEIIVGVAVLAALHLPGNPPLRNVIALAPSGLLGRVIRHAVVAGDLRMRVGGIGQHQRVLARRMLEIIIDALMLHEPADEVEGRLAVLYAVFPSLVTAAQPVLEIGEAEIAEHRLDDVRHVLVLEDAAVGAARQEPQPRPQRRAVGVDLADGLDVGEFGDMAVEMALALCLGQLDAHRHRGAEDLLGLDRLVGAEQVEVDLVEAAQLLAGAHMPEQQHVLAERCRNLELTVGLGQDCGHARLALM